MITYGEKADQSSYPVLGTIGARTLKAQVDHELVIPEQDRFVVPVDFGAVEK